MPQIAVTDAEVVELVAGSESGGEVAHLKVIGDVVYVGTTEDEATDADGFMLDQGDGTYVIPLKYGEVLYGICAAAATATVHVLVTG